VAAAVLVAAVAALGAVVEADNIAAKVVLLEVDSTAAAAADCTRVIVDSDYIGTCSVPELPLPVSSHKTLI